MGRRSDGVDAGFITSVSRNTAGTLDLGYISGVFNLTVTGTATAAELHLRRSFDGGNTYVRYYLNGAPVNPVLGSSETFYEPEQGVMWQVNVVSVTGGTVVVRVSQ